MRCERCGQESKAGAGQCAHCGAALSLPSFTRPAPGAVPGTAPSQPPSARISVPPKIRDPRRLPPPVNPSAPPAPARRRVLPATPAQPSDRPPGAPGPGSALPPLPRDTTSPWSGPGAPDASASTTQQVSVEQLLSRARLDPARPDAGRGRPWDQVIAHAPPSTLERWGTTPEAEADTSISMQPVVMTPPKSPAVAPRTPAVAPRTPAPAPRTPAPAPPASRKVDASLPSWADELDERGTSAARPAAAMRAPAPQPPRAVERSVTAPMSKPPPTTSSAENARRAPPPPPPPTGAARPTAKPDPRPGSITLPPQKLPIAPATHRPSAAPLPPLEAKRRPPVASALGASTLPWEVEGAGAHDLASLENAPVMLPKGASPRGLADDLSLPDANRIGGGPTPISGTMVGFLGPQEGEPAGEDTRWALAGELAGPAKQPPTTQPPPKQPPPKQPAAKQPPPKQPPPKAATTPAVSNTADAPGFSMAPAFDEGSAAEWAIGAPQAEAAPPLEETRAFELEAYGPDASVVPAELLTGPGVTDSGEIRLRVAGGGRRFFAMLLDLALIIGALQSVALLGLFGEAWTDTLPYTPDAIALLANGGGLIRPGIALVVLLLVSSTLANALLGRSPGKLLFGMRLVTRKTGKKPGVTRAIIRACLSVVSLVLGGAGYFFTLLDRERRTFHDLLTGTTVVRS
ncbi:MAG: RDD family protein [Deltaproteobacteria bacterium]|nr:RDD family protein [Deltaproteobacteria bacterium]